MGQGAIDYIGVKGGLDINGLIENYYVYAGENVSAGDFVEFINGVSTQTVETSVAHSFDKCNWIKATKLSKTKILVVHEGQSNFYLYALVCTINGATITAGTSTQISKATYAHANLPSIVPMGDNTVFVAYDMSYESDYELYSIVLVINGTAISYGESYALNTTNYTGNVTSACKLANGNVFVGHCYSSSYQLYGIVCKVNGTVISSGSDTALCTTNNTAGNIAVGHLSSNKVFVAHEFNSGGYLNRIICTVSDTTITVAKTTVSIVSQSYAGSKMSLVVLDTSRVFIAHRYDLNNYNLYGVVATEELTSIPYRLSSLENSGSLVISSALVGTDRVLVNHASDSTNYYLYGVVAKISDMVIYAGADTQLSDVKYSAYNKRLDTVRLIDGRAVIVNNPATLVKAQVFGIDEDTNVPTTTIITTTYETQVRSATALPCDAIAKTAGVGGDETGHNETVDIVRSPLIQYFTPTIEKDGDIYVNKISDYPIKNYDLGMRINIEGSRFYAPVDKTFTNDLFKQTWTVSSDYLTATGKDGTVIKCDTSSASPALAFDGDTTTAWKSKTTQRVETFAITFPEEIELSTLQIMVNDLASTQLKIYGGSSSSSNTLLYSEYMTDIKSLTTITLSNTAKYKYYEIEIGKTSKGYTAYIYELRAKQWTKTVLYTESFTNSYININGLGKKLINGTIEYGKNYQLRYNGISFDIVEG